jgi:hypothetical protein
MGDGMPTDTSETDSIEEVGAGGEGDTAPAPHSAFPEPKLTLTFRGSLFKSTISRVFTALDQMELGEVLAVCTNDP